MLDMHLHVKNNIHCLDGIAKLIDVEGKIVKDNVYRGQGHSEVIIANKHPWFSTTYDIELTEGFRGKECCLFRIHLMPGVKYIDVNELLENYPMAAASVSNAKKGKNSHIYAFEKEFIIKGGGYFYSDERGTPGFHKIKEGEFETWYSLERIEKKLVLSLNSMLQQNLNLRQHHQNDVLHVKI